MRIRSLICALLLPSLSAQAQNAATQAQLQAQLQALEEALLRDARGQGSPQGKLDIPAQKESAAPERQKDKQATQSQRGGPAKMLDRQRLQLLQKLQIDRSTSGILQARLNAKRLAEGKEIDQTPPQPQQKGKNNNRQTPEMKALQAEIQNLQLNVTLGNWDAVKEYLEKLPDPQSKLAFSRIVQQLAAPVQIKPRPELTLMGAKPHAQKQYFPPSEVLALSDTSKKAPTSDALKQLAQLIKSGDALPDSFFDALRNGTRYFGLKNTKTKLRTAELLISASYLDQAAQFLPELTPEQKQGNHNATNLIARYHAEAYSAGKGKKHLPLAWDLSLDIIADRDAPSTEKSPALYRALSLVPELEGATGKDWLTQTFAGAGSEGFEILAAVGTLTAQTREHRSPDFRLEQLKIQDAAAAALLRNKEIDLQAWKEILTFYARNWNAEAARANQLDTANSMAPVASQDSYGNLYYDKRRTGYKGPKTPPIDSGALLRIIPSPDWIALIDEPTRLDNLAQSASLFLKVKEETQAFPILKQLAQTRPGIAKDLIRSMIAVWGENHDPNQNSRRSRYQYYSGYNKRAESIPLTRSKQERNLKELATLVQKVNDLKLGADFSDEFADAFIQAHSKAEVWRVEALESVFGPAHALNPDTVASLLRRMRANLTNLWPNLKVQIEAKTKRKDKDLITQVLKGYAAATKLCQDSLDQNPDSWALQIQQASLIYEESNYRSAIASYPEHSANKRQALDAFATAAQDYIATLPREEKKEESDEPFTTWFYAALGSPDLGALKAIHQPIPSEFPKIKAALESIPEECRARHLRDFARVVNARLANVSPDLKYRFIESALLITGQHPRIEEASKVFAYYQDLITEITLDASLDGPDQIDATQPFGLFVNLRHTKEIERESGGFQRFLINQTSAQSSYNYGRPPEDYRDKFESAARNVLEEHFEVMTVAFHNSKVSSRTDPQDGWTLTPYAYFLLKAKGPQVDSIPPLQIDLDFLDTSGYVVLPITSAAIPIDTSKAAENRPFRDLTLTMVLDEREVEESGKILLDVTARAHGLIPPLEQLIKLPLSGLKIVNSEDRELQIEKLDPETNDGAPLSTHEYRLTFEPEEEGASIPDEFTFPEVIAPLSEKKDEGLILQKYEDVDLVSADATTEVAAGSEPQSKAGMIVTILLLILAALAAAYFLLRKKETPEEARQSGPSLPSTLNPVTVLGFLEKLQESTPFSDSEESKLGDTITSLKDRSFGPQASPPGDDELQKIATHWQESATQKTAA